MKCMWVLTNEKVKMAAPKSILLNVFWRIWVIIGRIVERAYLSVKTQTQTTLKTEVLEKAPIMCKLVIVSIFSIIHSSMLSNHSLPNFMHCFHFIYISDKSKQVVNISEEGAEDGTFVGGKAASLAILWKMSQQVWFFLCFLHIFRLTYIFPKVFSNICIIADLPMFSLTCCYTLYFTFSTIM